MFFERLCIINPDNKAKKGRKTNTLFPPAPIFNGTRLSAKIKKENNRNNSFFLSSWRKFQIDWISY